MKYFTLRELCASNTANRLHINNEPKPAIMANLTRLTDKLLDPIREGWGQPLIVTSGYRCPELNKAVGGTKNSQHMDGLAADLITLGNNRLKNYALFEFIKNHYSFDQLIAEKAKNCGCEWVHISINPTYSLPRNQAWAQ